ncbi:P-loop containing nucleoside triphosphate hydrolase protein [Mycotypha africana]|uniref:P-loop containing nucleoside triphosphate hydrolase protein n=1 Tax=Mycotypha africana TaxID=64632 RepID=UPI0023006DE7|nr:P-loop containing nucleoside triphosphate hydrolase protein [Mycotypha africana]KAI8970036.1 P-loop containing nucleoside triphosphate hydrolase protein [Mycotypha africana]
MKDIILTIIALLTGGHIQRLHSTGEIRILLKWQNCIVSIMIVVISTYLIISNISTFFRWHNRTKDSYNEENIFLPFTSRKVPTKWKKYIKTYTPSATLASPFSSSYWTQQHTPQLYYPRYCPYVFKPHYSQKSCAKPIPSFIFAGSEFSGSDIVFDLLRNYHPQISTRSVDNSFSRKQQQQQQQQQQHYNSSINKSSNKNTYRSSNRGLFINENNDDNIFTEANDFDLYMSQFPFLQQLSTAATVFDHEEEEEIGEVKESTKTETGDNVGKTPREVKTTDGGNDEEKKLIGEHAPQYLYHSYLTAKRIKDTLPHIKLVFILRDPISRAYEQYLFDKRTMEDNGHTTLLKSLAFENLIDLEIPILRRCGHTSTQTGWEGFVRCHQGSEIRASWKVLAASSSTTLSNNNENNNNNGDTYAFNMLAKGMYYPSLIPFLQHFPSSQLFIMTIEDIAQQPMLSLQKLANFLNIDFSHFLKHEHTIRSQLQLYLLQQQEKELEGLSLSTRYRLQKFLK